MTKIEQLLQHFNKDEITTFGPILKRLTSGKDPLLAPTLTQIHKTSEALLRLIQHEPLIDLGQTELKFLGELMSKKTDLLYAFGGLGDTKTKSAVSVNKYPTYFALHNLHENSPLLLKVVTQLLIWNYTNNHELIRSRVSWLVASLFNGSYPITDRLSVLIKETLDNTDEADLLSIASVVRAEALAARHDYDGENKKISEGIVYLIDQSLPP